MVNTPWPGVVQRGPCLYDREVDYHFDTIQRLSNPARLDPDAALLAGQMVYAGETRAYLRAHAHLPSEDVGWATTGAASSIGGGRL